MAHTPVGWIIVSFHQKASAAIKALEFYHKMGFAKPKPKKRKKKV